MKDVITARFQHTFRVRYSETDAQAIVHNSQYLVYFEVGRVEYLRAAGYGYDEMVSHGMEFVLVSSHIDYRYPARFDEKLIISVAIDWIKTSSFKFIYTITETTSDKRIAEGYTIHATLDGESMKPIPLPEDIRNLFVKFEGKPLEYSEK